MIELQHLIKDYGAIRALSDISISIPDGQVTVVIGPSGCGKTTLLRSINRLVLPTSGRIVINGKDTCEIKAEDLRRSIGYAIQGVGLFPHWTVAENIATVPKLLGWDKDRIKNRISELLELVGLPPDAYSNRYPAELSGGQAQRVGVARALAADPPVLLMDEPFGAVDPLTRIRLQNEFMRIQSNLKKTVIFVTHDLEEAIRMADRIAIMNSGEIIQYDVPEIILSHPADKFVHDFVGTDRALKRLSRFKVSDFVKQTASVKISQINNADLPEFRFRWVTNDDGVFKGWLDSNLAKGVDLTQALVTPGDEFALSRDATLRQALSSMLGQGVTSLPVVDECGIFLGEVTLADVEKATADGSQN